MTSRLGTGKPLTFFNSVWFQFQGDSDILKPLRATLMERLRFLHWLVQCTLSLIYRDSLYSMEHILRRLKMQAEQQRCFPSPYCLWCRCLQGLVKWCVPQEHAWVYQSSDPSYYAEYKSNRSWNQQYCSFQLSNPCQGSRYGQQFKASMTVQIMALTPLSYSEAVQVLQPMASVVCTLYSLYISLLLPEVVAFTYNFKSIFLLSF